MYQKVTNMYQKATYGYQYPSSIERPRQCGGCSGCKRPHLSALFHIGPSRIRIYSLVKWGGKLRVLDYHGINLTVQASWQIRSP